MKNQEIESISDVVNLGFEYWKNYKAFDTEIPMTPEEKRAYQEVRLITVACATSDFENRALNTYSRSLILALQVTRHPAAEFLENTYNSLYEKAKQN